MDSGITLIRSKYLLLNRIVIWAVFVVAMTNPFGSVEAAGTSSGRAVIFTEKALWRMHKTVRNVAYGKTAAESKIKEMSKKNPRQYTSPSLDANWTLATFDDSGWGRRKASFAPLYGLREQPSDEYVSMLALRGKFTVTNPAQVKDLSVQLVYRGGVVVYVNGKELVRKHIKEGALSVETAAEEYPLEAYVSPAGKIIRWGWGDPGRYKDRLELRMRRVKAVIPSGMLVKGKNVIALSFYRAVTHPDTLKLKGAYKGRWPKMGVHQISLSAATETGLDLKRNDRPAGLQVWNMPVLKAVYDYDFGDSHDLLRPIRIGGARRGTFSGKVVVGCDKDITDLKCIVSEFKGPDVIPGTAVVLRYGKPVGKTTRNSVRNVHYFDPLMVSAPKVIKVEKKEAVRSYKGKLSKPGAVCPVWVTVNIPKNIKPGDYTSELIISAQSHDVIRVPVELHVSDWTLPKPHDLETVADHIQSPESIALRYDVPMWSEAHWKLIRQSLKQLARIGNKVAYIRMINYSNLGNSSTWVRWIKKDDGTFEYDFSIFDRYLDLYEEEIGKPKVTCFYVWDIFAGGGYFGRKTKKWRSVAVTQYDPESKKETPMDGAKYNTPEAETFWKPVSEAILERMKKRGWEDTMAVGVSTDNIPAKLIIDLWRKLWPHALWVSMAHPPKHDIYGVKVVHATYVWGGHGAIKPCDPSLRRYYGWRSKTPLCHNDRDIWKKSYDMQLDACRTHAEFNITGTMHGWGRLNADFWEYGEPKGKKGKRPRIPNRYPQSNWSQLNMYMGAHLYPGPEGAISTLRFEMIIESLQECQARIFIERVLLDKEKRAVLGEENAVALQEILDERLRAILYGWYNYQWQERSYKLFDAAGKVSALINP
ncbi:MAG: hypothetical protein KAH23_03730 [Kiritimatiellae bacterium]|nr:hypothetical protein [Kiritimatiellia bacterium]